MRVDAVVVAANEQLQITGGVGAVVARAAGAELLQEACDAIGFCATGSAVATPGFDLPADFIIHAVGPIWRTGSLEEQRLLVSAYTEALRCAASVGAHSIALPLLSAGSYGCPASVSFSYALRAVRDHLEEHDAEITIVLYDRAAVAAGLAAYGEIASYIDDRYIDDQVLQFGRERASQGRDASMAPRPAAAYGAPRKRRPSIFDRLRELRESRRRDGGVGADEVERVERYERYETADYSGAFGGYAPAPPDQSFSAAAPSAASAAAPPAAPATAPPAAPMLGSDDTAGFPPIEELEAPLPSPMSMPAPSPSLDDWLSGIDASFSTTLLALIDARGLTDAEVYKRANMSRQLFSKIRSDAAYRPTKKTALALAVALHLNLDETADLLRRAGFALSHSSKADIIVEYFIARGECDIFAINEALYAFDQPLL